MLAPHDRRLFEISLASPYLYTTSATAASAVASASPSESASASARVVVVADCDVSRAQGAGCRAQQQQRRRHCRLVSVLANSPAASAAASAAVMSLNHTRCPPAPKRPKKSPRIIGQFCRGSKEGERGHALHIFLVLVELIKVTQWQIEAAALGVQLDKALEWTLECGKIGARSADMRETERDREWEGRERKVTHEFGLRYL